MHRQPVRNQQRDAAINPHRSQSDDERIHFEPRDQRAVDQAAQRARGNSGRDRDRNRITLLHRQRAHESAEREDRTDREIDAARNNDQRHSQRHNVDHRRLANDRREIRARQKMRRRNRQAHEQSDQSPERQQALNHCATFSSNAASRKISSCDAPLGNSPAIRPCRITRMRSATA